MHEHDPLFAIATSLGVLHHYTDLHGAEQRARPEAVAAVLRAMGVDPAAPSLPDAVARPPAQVRQTDTRHPLTAPPGVDRLVLTGEDGQSSAIQVVDGHAELPANLPAGRYAMTIPSTAGDQPTGTLLLAPPTCFTASQSLRGVGLFMPHHALHTDTTRGLGDFSALAALGRIAATHGARVLATLPLLTTFLHDGAPYEPSPYAPVSRLFWGEHLIDPHATPEWEGCETAHARLEQARADGSLAALRAGDRVHPKRAWALQRDLLGALAQRAWADPARERSLSAWADAHPTHRAYARFRAATEEHGPWPTWPSPRDASGEPGVREPGVPVDSAREAVWIYAQYEAQRQLTALRDGLERDGVALYLDLPIGVHPDGFDTWFWGASVFAKEISAGAPPDPYFPSGQDWGFPPIDPLSSDRVDGHGYLLACLRAHARMAHLLRLDHVMGFYRLFWVPRGLGASQGVYVRYPAAAWWAALCIASQELRCEIVGENLGMVPPEVDAALHERAIRGMAVAQFHLTHHDHGPMRPIPHGVVASLNTHDTPTFAGWWRGADLDQHQALGWLSGDRLEHERHTRALQRHAAGTFAERGSLGRSHPEAARVAAGLYRALVDSPAHLVLLNLEDLWAEPRPHNVPGTWRELPNWLRRSALSVEQIANSPAVAAVLADLQRED